MKPDDMFKQLPDAVTPQAMRLAIQDIELHNPTVHHAMMWARNDGLSAEDTYTALAYYALRALVLTQREHLDLLRRSMVVPRATIPS